MAAKPSKADPMELAMRVAASSSTGTPATSAIALISFAVGLVMLFPLAARGYGPIQESPCSTRPPYIIETKELWGGFCAERRRSVPTLRSPGRTLLRQQCERAAPGLRRRVVLEIPDPRFIEPEQLFQSIGILALAATLDRVQRA